MRIFLLSAEPTPRGVLGSLVSLGIEPIVARPGGDSEVDGIIRYVRVAHRGDWHFPMDLRWSRKALRAAIRDTGPDLLHITGDPWTPTAEAGAAAARYLKIPYALVGTSSRGGPAGFTAKWQSNRVREGALGWGGISRPALDLLAGTDRQRPTAVLPWGGYQFPKTLWRHADAPPVVFGVMGRLTPERGVDLFFDSLAETFGDWRVRILGSGPLQQRLEGQAQQLGLSSRIEWLGGLPKEHWPAFFNSIHALVAPSRSTAEWVEPTGNILLEAMAHGVAPIVTRCGALPDVVAEDGLVIEENDRHALTRALQTIVTDPHQAITLGEGARKRALQEFGDAAIAERLVKFWSNAATPSRLPA